MEIFKTRLIAKGFYSEREIDYEETFSLVAMLKSIRILLFIATVLDFEIWQIDVKTAFLTGILKKTSTCINQMDSYKKTKNTWYVSCRDPFMD